MALPDRLWRNDERIELYSDFKAILPKPNATALLERKSGQRDLCQYLITPIYYIHQDLLEPIFLAGMESDNLHGPLRVASVCYRWKEIAHATPALWNHVSVNNLLPGTFNLAKLWLSRCRFPSLTLGFRDISLTTLAQLLVSSQTQIRRLELHTTNANDDRILQAIIDGGHGDELEEIVIKHEENIIDDLPVPHIKRLYLEQVPTSWSRTSPPQQLTILRITDDIHWEMLDLILSECTVLQKLYASMAEDGPRPLDRRMSLKGATTHSHLTYLGLSYTPKDGEFPSDLISSFSFPSLSVFECHLAWTSNPEVVSAATKWLDSLPFLGQLKRLSLLIEFKVPQSFYDSLLSRAEAIEELSAYFDLEEEPQPNILRTLITFFHVLESPPRLPNLKSLHFSSYDSLTPALDEIFGVGQMWASIVQAVLGEQYESLSLWAHHWDRYQPEGDGDNTKDKQLGFLQRIPDPGTHPNLEFKFCRHNPSEWITNFPLVFEMYPLALNEGTKYEIVNSAGKWAPKSGPVYRIV
ncbi:hypothetical protein BDN72DRAFT_846687 [Pluteus cervinus]|uniref:Uncharacterized protein n=1 Tax=Pluteus cervinus TaxID=181527 RepID=A0ACD3AFX8_9AGAR|nr:hypothetical protein BDN72DRAFT_846687 [Pluteus cervinus]